MESDYIIITELGEIQFGDTFQVILGHPGNQYWSKDKIWTEETGPGPKGMEKAIKTRDIRIKQC